MSLDKELCRCYIGRDAEFWERVDAALETAKMLPEVQDLLEKLSDALLKRRDVDAGTKRLEKIAELSRSVGPLVPLGALAELLPEALRPYRDQGADDDILKETFGDVLRWVNWYKNEYGEDGLAELGWAVRPYANKIYKIGSLQYESIDVHLPIQAFRTAGGGLVLFSGGGVYVDHQGHACRALDDTAFITSWKQTDNEVHGHLIDPQSGVIREEETWLPLDGLTQVMRPGTPAMTMHIPAGTSLDPQDVDESLRRAKLFFKAAHMPFDACVCHSWMLDPQLNEFLPKTSRIRMLADRYARFSMAGGGSAARFVFATDTPVEKLPESVAKTSLQKAVYAYLRSGKKLHDYGGVMLL